MDGFQRRRRAEPCVEEDVLRGDSCRLDLLQQIEDDGWRFHLRELALLSAVASCIDGCAGLIEPDTKFGRISSKAFTKYFSRVIEEHKAKEREKLQGEEGFDSDAFDYENRLKCETQHIDGSMNALEKDEHLDWLRAEPDENVCKILFNVRCLSEGVDVPALDAVLFLSPRKSMVDVVQTVGRVMRKAPGKRRGYVIIPIVTPSGVAPDLVLDNNKDFDTVWQVLRALRSIDSNFGTIVDGQLGKIDESKMEVICLTNNELRRRGAGKAAAGEKVKRKQIGTRNKKREQNKLDEQRMKEAQASFDFGRNEILENELKARIVKRVGNRREWEEWAEDVGEICQEQIKHIQKVLDESPDSQKVFEGFRTELKETLNGELSDDEIVEMLGQHIVTKPILDAVFGDFPFAEKNPISKAMGEMLESLDKEGMKKATALLKSFYEAVQFRMKNVKTAAEKQTVIKELFEKFFKYAFPKQQEKLGIVYTPVEIVDFINQSVADVLKREFNTDIAEEGVHILDPFAGTGTFLARMIETGIIPQDKLKQKFEILTFFNIYGKLMLERSSEPFGRRESGWEQMVSPRMRGAFMRWQTRTAWRSSALCSRGKSAHAISWQTCGFRSRRFRIT